MKKMKKQTIKNSAPSKADTKKQPVKKGDGKQKDKAKEKGGGLPLGLCALLADIIESFVDACLCGGLRVVSVVRKSLPSVPTSDRIKIPNRVVAECKKAVKDKKGNKANGKKPAPAPLFTADEQSRIVALRKKGLTIKQIAKAIKRRDKAVSAFLKSAK